jgi:uncharacterized protein (DUF952 family)
MLCEPWCSSWLGVIMAMILHLISKAEYEAWQAQPASEPLRPVSLAREGFIHCTAGDDLMLTVANLFYKDQAGDFLVLEIDESKVTAEVKWEAPSSPASEASAVQVDPAALPPEVKAEFGNATVETAVPSAPAPLFPHIYGPLNRDAVTGMRRLVRAEDGAFTGYAPVAPAEGVQTQVVPPEAIRDPNNPLNIKTPSQMAQELLDETDEFSESLKRFKDRVEGRMAEIDEKIKKL